MKYKVETERGGRYVYGADYFQIEEGGILVFYESQDPHDGQSMDLGDVAAANERAIRAFNEWDEVDEE